MKNILNYNKEWMLSPRTDGTEFDAYRTVLWKALRNEYPTKVDPKLLKGESISETENAAAFITR